MTKRSLSILFCGILSAIGVLLIILGITSANGTTGTDLMSTHMLLTVPGILGIGSGLLCLTRKHHRSGVGFVLLNLLYTLLGGFLIECIYFQFIHFGTVAPQPRLAIPAIGIVIVYAVFYMIFHIIFNSLYGKCKK